MSEYTPGPWKYIRSEEDRVDSAGSTIRYMADILDREVPVDDKECQSLYRELDANGKLIAAAPEMADALIECCEKCESSVCGGCSIGRALHTAGLKLAEWHELDIDNFNEEEE